MPPRDPNAADLWFCVRVQPLNEEDLRELGLETLKLRKFALNSLDELRKEAAQQSSSSGGDGAASAIDVGQAAEQEFLKSFHRHRRLSQRLCGPQRVDQPPPRRLRHQNLA